MWGTPRQTVTSVRQINHTRIEDDDEIKEFYELGKCLGKGSFGTVLQATQIKTAQQWAIKAINKEKAGGAGVKLLEREVSIMKRVQHPAIIHLEEVYESNKKMFLVMEICDLGGLDELLKKKGCFLEKETRCVMKQLAGGIAYLHHNDIIHRDLKLENILLSHPVSEEQPINIKITDFGLSYIRGGMGSDYMMQQVCGTPIYMAPEVINNLGYSQQCDIWSMGVIMFSLVTGSPPFSGTAEEQLYESIQRGEVEFTHARWQEYSSGARMLMDGMLKADPAHRFTSKEVLNHPWHTGENCENGQKFNVLEMMKQYNLEQKRAKQEAGRIAFDNYPDSVTEREKVAQSDITASDSDSSVEVRTETEIRDVNANLDIGSSSKLIPKCPKSAEPGKSVSKSLCAKLHPSRSTTVSSKTGLIPDPNKSSPSAKKTARTNTLPSYMMPTKSSVAPKNPNRKEIKKR